MAIQIPIIEAVSGLFKSIVDGIDDWHTSDEEKIVAKGKVYAMQGNLLNAVFEYEKSMMQMQANVIMTEAKGESWIQRSWRPITMLVFVSLVVARWMGLTVPGISEELELSLMGLIKIGLGGYVVGRSAEKVAKSVDVKGLWKKSAGD